MPLGRTAPFCAAIVLFSSLFAQAQNGHKVDLWLTSADRTNLFAEQHQPLAFSKQTTTNPIIDVSDKTRYQQMDGFGFALTGGSAELLMKMDQPHRTAILKELFTTDGSAIGVSYLRVSIGSSDMNERVFTYDDVPDGQRDPQLAHFDLGPDRADVVPVLKEILAINPKISILGSPWSPPSWMKTNNNPKGGSLRPEFYDIYAQYFIKYIHAMAAEGIRIDAITVQNEPLNPKNTPSLLMTSKEEGTFIASALGPALRKAKLKTKIILYDHNCDRPDYPLDILADPQAAQYVAGSGFHLYGGAIDAMTKVHDAHPDKNLYFTEQMITQEDTSEPFKIAGSTNRVVIGVTRNWSRNVLLWNLAADPKFGPHTDNGGCPVCQGAITLDGNEVTRNLAFYTVAQVSKFVRPGSARISSENSDIPNVAFETRDHKKVLLVANPGHDAKTFSVRFHDAEFTSTLGAGDVGTYIWR